MNKQLSQSGTQVGEHAIVIGASISGLLMAGIVNLIKMVEIIMGKMPENGVSSLLSRSIYTTLTQ